MTDMRNFIMIVEALNSPTTIDWKKEPDWWKGDFQTPKGRWFQISIVRIDPSTWAFEFAEVSLISLWVTGRIERPSDEELAGNAAALHSGTAAGSRTPTGRGEQFTVYSTVLAAMMEFLTAERPERVRFKGATGKQTKLYQLLMQRHKTEISDLGYRPKGAALVRSKP